MNKTAVRGKGLDIDTIMSNTVLAANQFKQFDQERTDRIVKNVYRAGFNNRIRLAKMAFEETKLGAQNGWNYFRG